MTQKLSWINSLRFKWTSSSSSDDHPAPFRCRIPSQELKREHLHILTDFRFKTIFFRMSSDVKKRKRKKKMKKKKQDVLTLSKNQWWRRSTGTWRESNVSLKGQFTQTDVTFTVSIPALCSLVLTGPEPSGTRPGPADLKDPAADTRSSWELI